MKDTESKLRTCTEDVVKHQENLIPTEDRLRQISEIEKDIINLKTEQKSIEIKYELHNF